MPLVPVFTPLGCVTLHLNHRLCGSVCSLLCTRQEKSSRVWEGPRGASLRGGGLRGPGQAAGGSATTPHTSPVTPPGQPLGAGRQLSVAKSSGVTSTPAAHHSWARLAGAVSCSSLLQAALSAPVPHAAVDEKLPALKKMQRAYLDAPKGMGCLTFSAAGDTLRHDLLV